MDNVQVLCWLDLETTGLDPQNDHILEVSVSLADFRDPFDAHVAYTRTLFFPKELHHVMDPYVLEMHTKSGLLDECADSVLDVERLEQDLLNFVPHVENRELRPILAGSTCHFDRGFLDIHVPKVSRRLMHRHYDVSSLKLACQSFGMSLIPKAEAHRAEKDVAESIAHAKVCREWMKSH